MEAGLLLERATGLTGLDAKGGGAGTSDGAHDGDPMESAPLEILDEGTHGAALELGNGAVAEEKGGAQMLVEAEIDNDDDVSNYANVR